MKERPIIFRPEMVAEINDGRKTQTRRIITLREFQVSTTQGYDFSFRDRKGRFHNVTMAEILNPPRRRFPLKCPFGVPGDRLWVREKWRLVDFETDSVHWSCAVEFSDGERAWNRLRGGEEIANERTGWRSPIFLPRWASRLTLEITDVRVQRVQEISDEDAIAEGVARHGEQTWYAGKARDLFAAGWDTIHGQGAWDRNDWVWAITFRKVTP